MKIIKRITKNKLFLKLICFVVFLYIRFIFFTCKKNITGRDNLDKLQEKRQRMIFALWHGHILLIPCLSKRYAPVTIMASRNRDGDITSSLVKLFGVFSVRGSSSRGAKEVALGAVNALKNGSHVCITPDGPRGPGMKAAKGAAAIARFSGCPLIPVGFASSKATILHTWDRFIITHPFSRIAYCFGEPLFVDKNADDDEITEKLENEMNRMTDCAKELVL